MVYAKFCFHKYLLEVRLFHKLNWLFGFRASSVQRGYPILSVLAFLLVLCVFRGGRRFLISSRVQGLKFKYSRLNKRTYPLNLKHRTLNSFSSLNFFTTSPLAILQFHNQQLAINNFTISQLNIYKL
ncbi:hypothetical protein D1003_10355 [Riemerella anatipestifer]|nr:hypothetical protein [Riemerella anatipestifer]